MTSSSTATQEVDDTELAAKPHLLPGDEKLLEATASILVQHESADREENIRWAIVHWLATARLADRDDIKGEVDRIDIQSERLIIETKRRIGTGIEPDQDHISQLDRYIDEAKAAGKPDRLGVLTDGKYWVLRLPNIKKTRLTEPYVFTLRSKDDGYRLYEWLLNETRAIESSDRPPNEEEVRRSFGPGPRFENEIAALESLYQAHRTSPTIAVKRQLWADLLTAALGISVKEEPDLDQLFLRHTYLSAIVGLAVQAAFGIDLREKSRLDAAKLLTGEAFRSETGVQGVIDSDFFAWPAEVGGEQWIVGLADRVARFDWTDAEYDFARILYQSVIPTEDRRRLGEYYTPDWLAKAVVDEVVTDPLNQRVLDPSCGSGTFLYAAVQKYITAAKSTSHPPERILDGLTQSVIGIDVHPVSVHLARATWVLAAREIIAKAGRDSLIVPVYLGDSLQLRTDPGDLFAEDRVTITVAATEAVGENGGVRRLDFPRALVEQPDWFDRVMLGLSQEIVNGGDPKTALDDNDIPRSGSDREMLEETAIKLQDLHAEGRNHIWAYYTRNLVRPVWLASENGQVDAIVGNPPWLTYNKTEATIRSELERQSKKDYKIWVGGKNAANQDIAGLFYTRCFGLYLKKGGKAGMVLPHSALAQGQYEKWRSGIWHGQGLFANLSAIKPWDLERIEPNTFFPIASCVVFAKREKKQARSLASVASRWLGKEGGPYTYEEIQLAKSSKFSSLYSKRARRGADIFPRVLYFVDVQESAAALTPRIKKVSSQRSSQEKEPWKSLQPRELVNVPIEEEHIWDIYLGETVAPYVLLEPRKAVLPVRKEGTEKVVAQMDLSEKSEKNAGANRDDSSAEKAIGKLDTSDTTDAICRLDPKSMEPRMRERWRIINELWNANKNLNNKLDLLGNLDYMGKLSAQLEDYAQIRLLYATSGRPTAAILLSATSLVDTKLYWVKCKTLEEAHYLAAIINSNTLEQAVQKFMPKGQFGARDLHKHLWRLPIPIYDNDNSLHANLAQLGNQLATEATTHLTNIRTTRAATNKPTTITVARRELRKWLSTHPPAQQIEKLVAQLLS